MWASVSITLVTAFAVSILSFATLTPFELSSRAAQLALALCMIALAIHALQSAGGSVFQPAESMSQMFAAGADVLLLNQLASVKDTVIPSKLLTYMAAGRPVLAAVNSSSQGAEILREANGGMLVAPEDPLALVRGVEALMSAGPGPLAAMGARNRAYAEQQFDQRKILAEHEKLILGHLANTRHRRGAETAA